MAFGTNKIKGTNNILLFFNLIIILLRKFAAILLIILSCYLLYFSSPNILSSYSLELTGKIIFTGIKFYDFVLTPIKAVTNKLSYLSDLKTENDELKLELDRLKSLEVEYQILKVESDSLKEMLKIIPEPTYNYTKTRLLSVSINPFSKTLLIGGGSNQGIKVNQIVTNNEGLIGRVINTSENYAKVMLVTDSNSRIPVITSLTRQRAILAGDNNKFSLSYLLDYKDIVDKEIIITSGDGKIYPYGIPIAKIEKKDNDKIILKAIVNLNKTEFVNVYEPIK